MATSRAQMAKTAGRRAQAIELRLAGLTYDQIAEQLGYAGRAAAHQDITRALHSNLTHVRLNVEEYREEQRLRLERLLRAVWPEAVKGNLQAVETARRLIDQEARMFGIGTPAVRLEMSTEVIEERIAQLQREIAAAQVEDAEVLELPPGSMDWDEP